jgi:hypothetical protein
VAAARENRAGAPQGLRRERGRGGEVFLPSPEEIAAANAGPLVGELPTDWATPLLTSRSQNTPISLVSITCMPPVDSRPDLRHQRAGIPMPLWVSITIGALKMC